MKNKIVYIIIFIILLLIGLTFYKYKFYKNKHFFTSLESELIDINASYNDTKDKEIYKDNIITTDLLEVKYNLLNKIKSITGRIFIDNNKQLYITNEVDNEIKRISDYKFKTLYKKENNYNEIHVYLISYDYKLYELTLPTNDINKVKLKLIPTKMKVYNFVNISYRLDMYKDDTSVFVLLEDDNIYDIKSKWRYNFDTISMYDKFYVLKDKTIIDKNGYSYVDNNKTYKIKYTFSAEKNEIVNKDTIMIVTLDNYLLYVTYNDNKIYKFNKKVKDIKFTETKVAKKGTLTITFIDNYKIKLNASCNEYFCINKLEE